MKLVHRIKIGNCRHLTVSVSIDEKLGSATVCHQLTGYNVIVTEIDTNIRDKSVNASINDGRYITETGEHYFIAKS